MLNELFISAAMLGGLDFPEDIESYTCGREPLQQFEAEFTDASAEDRQDRERLTQEERKQIVRAWHLAVNKMNHLMNRAEYEAQMIYSVDVRRATVGLIQGAISGIASKNIYTATVGACLVSMGTIAGDSYVHFCRSKVHVRNAKFYAYTADQLQEKLWRG